MSTIKGGGRAKITSDTEESIISLLLNLRDPKNPLLPRRSTSTSDDDHTTSFDDLSDHDKRKERKRFLKKLLKCHQHQQLSQKLNQMSIHEQQPGEVKPVRNSSHGSTVFQTHESNAIGKVRIEIVEAILKNDDKKKSKKSSKNESRKSVSKWREGGTRKAVVLPRATGVKELKKLCKAKLQMKIPQRLFIVDKDSKVEMDLILDLSGIDDGTLIYATTSSRDAFINEGSTKEVTNDIVDKEIVEQDHNIDHLQPIKDVYRMHKVSYKRPTSCNNDQLPKFGPFLDNLEPLSEERAALPSAAFRDEILQSFDESRVLIICGATGCGKSTQVPQYIYEGMKAIQQTKSANIIVTQPRRVAAISLAKRVCVEIGCPQPGNPLSEVGYNVRLARATSDATKITYCTVGVLLRMLVNPLESYGDDEGDDMPVPLSNVSHVIIDEVHERDLNTDFVLTLLRPLLIVNKRISIILMSATASASLFADYFSMPSIGLKPRILDVPGRTYPISTLWLEDIEMMIKKKIDWKDRDIDLNTNSQESCDVMSPRTFAKIDYYFIKSIILDIGAQEWKSDRDIQVSSLEKENGSVLVFLPGKGEIDALSRILYNDSQLGNHGKCAILKLHSSLSPSQQWRAFQPVTYGILKVVLATNVAETSITIPDVSYVIDTGRVKEVRFNPESRIKDLVTVWISKASSRQRAGRAGRTGPGVSYKLYSERYSDKVMQESTSPEIMRLPLEDLILQVCLLKEQHGNEGVNPIDFLKNAPEPPSKESIEQACSHLVEIGAIQSQSKDCFRLTSLGYHLAHLPMDAKVGKILITGCILQCIEPALTIAGILSSQKSCWLDYIPGVENSRDLAHKKQTDVIKDGFGGTNWSGGCLKGDLIAQIAVFDAWVSSSKENRKRKLFANSNGLDHEVLRNIEDLRFQFKEALTVSGLLSEYSNTHGDDVLLTSCCLVAGLYPNISTLLRPSRERKIRGGRLITQDGSLCKASSNSFQKERIRNASENGKDAYAVYHSKHRIIGVANSEQKAKEEPFLSNINFVPRFAVLLFGGNIEVKKNCLILDKWLKFKVDDMESNSDKISEKCQINAILIKELRKEIDQVVLKQISKAKICHKSDLIRFEKECEDVIRVIRMLLVQD